MQQWIANNKITAAAAAVTAVLALIVAGSAYQHQQDVSGLSDSWREHHDELLYRAP